MLVHTDDTWPMSTGPQGAVLTVYKHPVFLVSCCSRNICYREGRIAIYWSYLLCVHMYVVHACLCVCVHVIMCVLECVILYNRERGAECGSSAK